MEYTATNPSLVTVDVARHEARAAFKGYERLMFRMLRIKHFLRMELDGDGAQIAPLDSRDRRRSA